MASSAEMTPNHPGTAEEINLINPYALNIGQNTSNAPSPTNNDTG